jgi:hypothetical protein
MIIPSSGVTIDCKSIQSISIVTPDDGMICHQSNVLIVILNLVNP